MAEKTLPFRIYAQILIFSALVALGAVILWPLQRAVQGGMIGIRDNLITSIERQIDRKIQYSSISPSLFGSFDVRGVRVMGKDELPVLSMSRFRIAYSLVDLLRGRVQAIHSIRIDAPLIDFNTTRDYDLIEVFEYLSAGEDGSRRNFPAMLPEKLIVRIRNGKCLILNSGDQFELDALNLNIEIVHSRIILDGEWNINVTIDQLVGEPISLDVAMKASGSCRTDMEEGEAVLSIPSITGDAQSANPIAFGLVLDNGIIRMGKMPDQLPFDFSLEYGIHDDTIDAQFECVDFSLRNFISFSGGLEGISQFLDIAGSGAASFERRHDGSLGYSVNLAGAALAPPVSVSPAPGGVSLPFNAESSSFRIDAAGNEQRAVINTLRFSMPQTGRTSAFFFGDISFNGSVGLAPIAPDGIFSLSNFTLSGSDMVNANVAVNTSGDGSEITVFCDALKLGRVDLAGFRALLKPAENNLGFTVSAVRSPDSESGREPAGALSLEGSLYSTALRMEAGLRLNEFSAGDIAGMALPFIKDPSLAASLKGLRGGPAINTEALFTISGRDRRFELNSSRFVQGEDVLSLSGMAAYTGPKDIAFTINAGYRDLGYMIEGALLNGRSVNIRGSYGLNVQLASSARGYTGSMRAEGFPVPFLGQAGLQPARLFCAAQIRYDTAASWQVNLEQFELTDIAGPAGPAQIRISGSADQRGASIPLLYYRDKIGPLNGTADISWPADYSGFTAAADMRDGMETYHAEGYFSEGSFNLAFSGSSMRLDRVFGSKVNALAQGDIRLTWKSFDSFQAELNLVSINGKIFDQEFGASGHVILDSEDIIVSGVHFKLAELDGIVSYVIISAIRGTAETMAEITGFAGGKPVEGALLLTANFRPARSWLEIDKILNSFNGAAQVKGLKYGGGAEEQTFDIAFSRSGGALSVSGGPRDMIRFQMDHDGNFYAGLSNPFPVRGTIIGSVKQKIIDARCSDLYIDVGELFNLLPIREGIYLTGGYVNAAVDIRGSVSDPEFFGSARGTSLRVRIPQYITQELRPIPFSIAIEGNEMRFGPVPTTAGNGAGTVSGWFLFDRWIPNIFNLDITVPRETPVPYGFDITGFVARGDASGKLNVSMENMTLDISGDLYANNTELGINSDEMPRNRGSGFPPSKRPFVLDLTVSTGPVVEFFYPQSRIPILRATPEIGTRIHVTADSLAQQFTLNSDVKIRSGEIFYFERSFFIRSGALTLRENELRFSPRLSARAEVRDRTEDGPVTISMIVDNAPLFSFTARFESNPPLSQMDIFALLGHNITGAQPDENTIARAFINTSVELGTQFLIGRQVEQQIRNFMRLDMFSVRTQVLQNAFLMATGFGQASGQAPVDRIDVGNYFDNTTVFGGKYIGQDMFVQGMLSMRYDANNTSTGGITFVPDIGIELQNPLFSIRWDFVPTHPENWYVNDNSITLTKSWTF